MLGKNAVLILVVLKLFTGLVIRLRVCMVRTKQLVRRSVPNWVNDLCCVGLRYVRRGLPVHGRRVGNRLR